MGGQKSICLAMFFKGGAIFYPVQARYWNAISASGLESDLKLLPGAIGDALGCFRFDSPMFSANLQGQTAMSLFVPF